MSPRAFLLAVVLCSTTPALHSQQVQSQFPELILSENFDHSNNYWATVANSDNLFIVQEGEYILNRKSLNSPYAIIGNFNQAVQNFRLVTSLRIEKANVDNPTMGVAFLLQSDNNGGFIVEINTQQQYRIKKILQGSYQYLSGTPTNAGWVSNPDIHKDHLFNLIEVKSDNGNFDLYMNSKYVQSFTQAGYPAGTIGYIIGAGTQGRVDFIYIFGKEREKYMASASNMINPPSSNTTLSKTDNSPDVLALAESIIKLKTQINDLKQENEELKWSINARIEEDKTKADNEMQFKNQIQELQTQLNATKVSVDSLTKINASLEKYRKIVGTDENADLIITLSKTVKAQEKTNEELKEKNEELQAENTTIKSELDQIKSQLSKISSLLTGQVPESTESQENQKISAPPPPPGNNSGGFVLPSDSK